MSLTVEDYALAHDIATEIVETAHHHGWMAFIGPWDKQVKRLLGKPLSYEPDDRALAQNRLARIQAHVEGS